MKSHSATILSVLTLIAIVALGGLLMTRAGSGTPLTPLTATSIYDIPVRDIKGRTLRLDQYKGKVMLIVNVASQCGYTPQYAGLQKLYENYREKGLVVLGFPANNFGGQEPGSEAEIAQFCSMKYNVGFPMFAKLSAEGRDIHPLYQFLTGKQTNPRFAGPITWNFNKFLIDRAGQPLARFDSSDRPESEKVVQAIENALK
jgi:glutathione peroxidase